MGVGCRVGKIGSLGRLGRCGTSARRSIPWAHPALPRGGRCGRKGKDNDGFRGTGRAGVAPCRGSEVGGSEKKEVCGTGGWELMEGDLAEEGAQEVRRPGRLLGEAWA